MTERRNVKQWMLSHGGMINGFETGDDEDIMVGDTFHRGIRVIPVVLREHEDGNVRAHRMPQPETTIVMKYVAVIVDHGEFEYVDEYEAPVEESEGEEDATVTPIGEHPDLGDLRG